MASIFPEGSEGLKVIEFDLRTPGETVKITFSALYSKPSAVVKITSSPL